MNTLLILYPELFACQAKFDRKVEKIIGQMDSLKVVYIADSRGFVEDHFVEDQRVHGVYELESLENAEEITHAIVFDDGEEFAAERDRLEQAGVVLRWIRVPLTRVVNIKRKSKYKNQKSTPTYEYIGRGSYWGNPHSMYEKGESREEVIRKYEYDFENSCFLNIDTEKVHELAGKRLGCFCKPAVCHGDVLAEFLNSYDDGK